MQLKSEKEMDYNGVIKKEVKVNLEIKLDLHDMLTWLNNCNDSEVLRKIERTARSYAKAIESPDDDDFRSRA